MNHDEALRRAAAEVMATAEVQEELRTAAYGPETPMSEATFHACQDAILDMMRRPVIPGPSFEQQRSQRDSKFAAMTQSHLIGERASGNTKDLTRQSAKHSRQIAELQEFFSKNFDE